MSDIDKLEKSYSDSETQPAMHSNVTPPNFIAHRERYNKRKREEDFSAEFSKFKEEIRSMISTMITTQEKEFGKNATALKHIQQTSSNIESSMAFLAAQNEEFKKKIDALEDKIKEDRKYITTLEDKLESMQMDCRKSNFEIKNAPKKVDETKEDLINMVKCLSNTVSCQLNGNDIKDVYRVRGKKENTPIVVETSSTILKNELLRSCKLYNMKQKTKLCAKHIGIRTSEDSPIFVTEQLTAKAARLHFLARELVKSKLYKYCWTAYGRVYIRREDHSPIIQIRNELQLQALSAAAVTK